MTPQTRSPMYPVPPAAFLAASNAAHAHATDSNQADTEHLARAAVAAAAPAIQWAVLTALADTRWRNYGVAATLSGIACQVAMIVGLSWAAATDDAMYALILGLWAVSWALAHRLRAVMRRAARESLTEHGQPVNLSHRRPRWPRPLRSRRQAPGQRR